MALSDKARQAKNAYQRRYRAKNRERDNAKQREYNKKWRDANKDKLQKYYESYWNKKASEMESCLDRAIAYETDNETDKKAETDIVCQHCGNSFEPKRKDARFCSASCRLKAYRLNK